MGSRLWPPRAVEMEKGGEGGAGGVGGPEDG